MAEEKTEKEFRKELEKIRRDFGHYQKISQFLFMGLELLADHFVEEGKGLRDLLQNPDSAYTRKIIGFGLFLYSKDKLGKPVEEMITFDENSTLIEKHTSLANLIRQSENMTFYGLVFIPFPRTEGPRHFSEPALRTRLYIVRKGEVYDLLDPDDGPGSAVPILNYGNNMANGIFFPPSGKSVPVPKAVKLIKFKNTSGLSS